MENSKVTGLIKTFSKAELKNFYKFLMSPFHNTNRNLVKLFLILQKNIIERNRDFNNKSVYDSLFQGKQFDYSRLRVLSSELLKVAEKFIAVNEFCNDNTEMKLYTLGELKKRKMNSLYKTNFREAEKIINTNLLVDQNYFLSYYKLYHQHTDYLVSIEEQIESAETVSKSGENLLSFFITAMLNIAHELKIQEEVANFKFESNIVSDAIKEINFNSIIKKMRVRKYRYTDAMQIYFIMFRAYTEPGNDKLYSELKKLINETSGIFSYNEKFNLYIILESICVSKISMGKRNFYKELLSIYKEMINKKIYLATGNDYFQLILFRNMFYTALLMKDFEWCSSFIENYSSLLHPEHSNDMYNFAMAHLNFEKNNFEEALKAIYKVNHDFFVFKYDSRIVMLKIFFETERYEQALSLIDSFSHYLTKNRKVSLLDKDRFGNFLKHVKNLVRIYTGITEFDEYGYKKKFGKENLISKKWIEEKYKAVKANNEERRFIWR